MSNEVEICNMAMALLGTRSTISSLIEDSNEARACNLVYANTRDVVLGMAFWNFARKTATLSELKAAPGTPSNPTATGLAWIPDWPAPPWLYEYAYPSDCVQIRFITPQITSGADGVPIFGPNVVTSSPSYGGAAVKFSIATDEISGSPATVILTNQYQAIGVYTTRITNTNLFGSQFIDALSAAIAGRTCMQLTGDKTLMKGMYELANSLILQARSTDGNEGLTIQDTMPDWIVAREGFGYPSAGYFTAPYNALFPIW